MKLTSKILAPTVVVFIIGGIFLSMGLGLWQTKSSRTPARYSSGRFTGSYDPADIRGSYSLYDIAASFDVTVEDLAKAFSIERAANYDTIEAGDLKAIYGEFENGEVGTDSIKYFVALYTGLPFVPEHDTLLPSTALPFLHGKVSDEKMAELERMSVDPSKINLGSIEPFVHEEDAGDTMIKGKTTFGDLVNWGLSREEIEEALGMEPGKSGANLRDHVTAGGMGFGQAKAKLQDLIDSRN